MGAREEVRCRQLNDNSIALKRDEERGGETTAAAVRIPDRCPARAAAGRGLAYENAPDRRQRHVLPDAFDAIAIAYVLPVRTYDSALAPDAGRDRLHDLGRGYAGQALGSLFFGWLGERLGRIPTAIITIAMFSATSLLCAFAWSYRSLLWIRFLQGLGLGGETPVMHAYIRLQSQGPRAVHAGLSTAVSARRTRQPWPAG